MDRRAETSFASFVKEYEIKSSNNNNFILLNLNQKYIGCASFVKEYEIKSSNYNNFILLNLDNRHLNVYNRNNIKIHGAKLKLTYSNALQNICKNILTEILRWQGRNKGQVCNKKAPPKIESLCIVELWLYGSPSE